MKIRLSSLVCVLTLIAVGCATSDPQRVGTGLSFKGPVGLQLYSLRGQFIKNVPATIETVQGFGIHDVELAGTYNVPPAKFREMLVAKGLNPVSGHFSFDRLRDDPEGVAKEAAELGLKFAGCAWIPHEGPFTEQSARKAAAVFNHAGEVLSRYGIRCFYHCHGYEFEPGAAGPNTTGMDILMNATNPRNVSFQMDILWVFLPGEDPARWLAKYPGRWALLHLKDFKKGLPTGVHTGKTDPNNDVALGTGQMNWPSILAAAKRSGVQYYFIEDESASSETQIPESLRYLESVRF